MKIEHFSQVEYNRILDSFSARAKGLGQVKCEDILIKNGASQEQAKNGAYVYIHHDGDEGKRKPGTKEEYTSLLNKFNAANKKPKDCIRYLKELGYSYGQSKSAVNNYRVEKGLIRK